MYKSDSEKLRNDIHQIHYHFTIYVIVVFLMVNIAISFIPKLTGVFITGLVPIIIVHFMLFPLKSTINKKFDKYFETQLMRDEMLSQVNRTGLISIPEETSLSNPSIAPPSFVSNSMPNSGSVAPPSFVSNPDLEASIGSSIGDE